MAATKEAAAEKSHKQILTEFAAITDQSKRADYFWANESVLKLYFSAGCFPKPEKPE